MCGSLDVTKFILDGKLLKKSISSAVFLVLHQMCPIICIQRRVVLLKLDKRLHCEAAAPAHFPITKHDVLVRKQM